MRPPAPPPSLRILHTADAAKWTGAAAPALAIAEGQVEMGDRAWLAFRVGNNLEVRLRDACLAFPMFRGGPARALAEVPALRRMIVRKEIGLVHTHLGHDHWIVELARQGMGSLPLVRTFHSRAALRHDPLHLALYRRLQGALAVNSTILKDLGDLIPSVPAAMIPTSVDTARFHPDTSRREFARASWGIGTDRFVLGAVGKMAAGRGFAEVLELAAALAPRAPRLAVVLVGKGELEPALRHQAERLGIAARITWAGYQEDRLPELYLAMDAFTFLAAGSDEGHRALLEAQACGIPAAALGLDGVPEVVAPGGAVAQPENLGLLVAALRQWYEEPLVHQFAGYAAAEFAAKFSIASIARRHREFLVRILPPA